MRPVGKRTVWCPRCADGVSWIDRIRGAGLNLADDDLTWTDGVAYHRTCGSRIVTGAHRGPFRASCKGCDAPLEGRQTTWCGMKAPAPYAQTPLCFMAWHHPRHLWQHLLEGQDGICHICDKPIAETTETRHRWDGDEYEWTAWDVEVDHIEPLARGGPRVLANLAVAHRLCNQQKKDKPLDVVRERLQAQADQTALFD